MAKQEACNRYIEKHQHDPVKWRELSESIAHDSGKDLGDDEIVGTLQELASSSAVENRGDYAPRLVVAGNQRLQPFTSKTRTRHVNGW